MRIDQRVSILEAEAVGIKEALSWVATKDMSHVSIESDSLVAVQAIEKGSYYRSEVGHVFQTCRLELPARSDLNVGYVRRLANRAAHVMARIPCQLNCFLDFSTAPSQLLESLLYDDIQV